jgi:hypothetical protein
VTPPPPDARYLYVANSNWGAGTAVYVCVLDSVTEAATSCQDAGGGGSLATVGIQGVVLSKDSTMAYLTNGISSPEIYQCPINTVDGTFGACTASPVTITNSGSPYNNNGYGMLTLNAANTIAYLVDTAASDRIEACPVSGGVIDSASCVATDVPSATFQSAEGIVINKASDTIYFADYSDGVYVCSVSGMSVGACVLKTGGSGITFGSVADVALNPDEDLIYITSYTGNEVYACSTAANGTNEFDTCIQAGSGLANAAGVVVNAKNTMAYVGSFTGTLYSCPILAGGAFGACTNLSGFNAAIGLTLSY